MKKGFTLTELLIVVAILGIMASIAIPRLIPNTERARVGEAVSVLTAIRQGQAEYRFENTTYLTIPCDGSATVAQWQSIGFEANPNSALFTYCVPTANATTFSARATRTATDNAGTTGTGSGTTACLNEQGVWSGDNIFRPQYATGAAAC